MLVVMVPFVVVDVDGNGTAALGDGATYVLELNRRMGNVEMLRQHGVQAPQDGVAGGGRNVLDEDVAAQGVSARSQAPDVQIVNIQDPFDCTHPRRHFPQADAARQTLQQDVERLPDDVPCGPDDQDADQDRQHRVDPQPAGVTDGDCASDNGDRSQGVPHEVDER